MRQHGARIRPLATENASDSQRCGKARVLNWQQFPIFALV
jgi:hypothetical protein